MKYEIIQDENADSPSDSGDTSLFLVGNHRDFYVPEPGEKTITSDPAILIEPYKKTHWILPLEAYIHSGVHLSLSREGNYPDRRWDVSQLGFVFVEKKYWGLQKSARKAALSLIESWNQYLSGDVWGYVITDDDGNEVESCWGFYGHDYCEAEAKSALANCVADLPEIMAGAGI